MQREEAHLSTVFEPRKTTNIKKGNQLQSMLRIRVLEFN